jgi:hypothetical protein
MMATPKYSVFVWAACLALSGCAGGPAQPANAGLVSDAPPLLEGSLDEWADASAGCEGMLDGSESWAVTSPDGLVVALRGGIALCVDTLPAAEEELVDVGLDEGAETLSKSYWATIEAHTLTSNTMSSPASGEPNPQPSLETGTPVRTHGTLTPTSGEPNPQPSDGEPNPQPSRPGDSDSGSNSTSGSDSTDGMPPPDDEPSGPGSVGGLAGSST